MQRRRRVLSQARHHAEDPARAPPRPRACCHPAGLLLILDLRQHDQAWWARSARRSLCRVSRTAALKDMPASGSASRRARGARRRRSFTVLWLWNEPGVTKNEATADRGDGHADGGSWMAAQNTGECGFRGQRASGVADGANLPVTIRRRNGREHPVEDVHSPSRALEPTSSGRPRVFVTTAVSTERNATFRRACMATATRLTIGRCTNGS